MTMFLIQSLLWLLAAFLLGYGIGRWLKGVFCKRRAVETQTKLHSETSHLRVPVTTAAVAAGTAATAALARSREPVKPTTVKEPELKASGLTAKAPVPVPELKATVTPLKADFEPPKTNLAAPAVSVTAPKLDTKLPEVDLPNLEIKTPAVDLPKTEVELPEVEVNLPEVEAPKLEVKERAAGVVSLGAAALGVAATQIKAPDDLATAPSGPVNRVELNKTTTDVELQCVERQGLELDTVQTSALASTEIGAVGVGLNPDLLDTLKKAALGLSAGAVVAKATDVLAELPKPVDESDLIEGAKTTAVQLERAHDLLDVEIGTTGQGLNAEFLDSLKTASASTELTTPKLEPINPPEPLAEAVATLPQPVDEADLIEVGKTLSDEWERSTDAELAATELASQTPVHLANLDLRPTHTTVKEVLATTAAETLAAQPKPVDESDVIEAGKNVVEAVLNPAGLTVTEIGSLGQGLNTDTLTGLKVAAASAATVAAVNANLQSGAQPMIVDESDAIEAIKLAWDGELSPVELAALEHTLILRPGETGRLGLVTCSVPGTNCVSLGGLEGDLNAGDAMRSNLFNMAVTHNDDGNYVFSSLSKWLPDWIKSGNFSEHTDELVNLVWDDDTTAVEHAAGYQLTLREGQYGDLGLVSCAVNEAGSVSLGGIVGSIAEGQTAVSKLYGIFVERVGDIYTFKQFSKPASMASWATNAQAAVTAVGVGMAAQASGAVDAVNEAVLPITKSMTTDMLEPDLTWSEDKLRINMQRLIEETHDQRGSKLVSQLWDSDSGYDCSVIEGEESLVLKPGLYGKLGSVHCGVTKPGRVVVSGDVSPLAEGEGVLFHLYNIVVCRDDEDNYRFERLKDLV